MKITIKTSGRTFEADLGQPMDISLPIDDQSKGPNAFYADRPKFDPYQSGDFVASVKQGGAINSYDVSFNPHGNGTHTECLGHITGEWQKITNIKGDTHHLAHLVTLEPEIRNGDKVLTHDVIIHALQKTQFVAEALVVRTKPNQEEKKTRQYSGTNPAFLEKEAMSEIVARGYTHLLIDLPSVDKEQDGGKVANHHIFWGLPEEKGRENCTITELIYVPDNIEDGSYLIDIQRAAFELDCSPSRPVLYRLTEIVD